MRLRYFKIELLNYLTLNVIYMAILLDEQLSVLDELHSLVCRIGVVNLRICKLCTRRLKTNFIPWRVRLRGFDA